MAEDRGQLMKYTSFLNSAIFELFLFSYSGNELLTEVSESFNYTSFLFDKKKNAFLHLYKKK